MSHNSYHTYAWVLSHMTESCHTHINESCHRYGWVMSHKWQIWLSHLTHTEIWTWNATHLEESCEIFEGVMAHTHTRKLHLVGWNALVRERVRRRARESASEPTHLHVYMYASCCSALEWFNNDVHTRTYVSAVLSSSSTLMTYTYTNTTYAQINENW